MLRADLRAARGLSNPVPCEADPVDLLDVASGAIDLVQEVSDRVLKFLIG